MYALQNEPGKRFSLLFLTSTSWEDGRGGTERRREKGIRAARERWCVIIVLKKWGKVPGWGVKQGPTNLLFMTEVTGRAAWKKVEKQEQTKYRFKKKKTMFFCELKIKIIRRFVHLLIKIVQCCCSVTKKKIKLCEKNNKMCCFYFFIFFSC